LLQHASNGCQPINAGIHACTINDYFTAAPMPRIPASVGSWPDDLVEAIIVMSFRWAKLGPRAYSTCSHHLTPFFFLFPSISIPRS
jgi:hypothetical protein